MKEAAVQSEAQKEIVITFAGDSGDGMQLTGFLFSVLNAIWGSDVQTLPDYPAEIRAPAGTVHGVSGYQVRVSSSDISSPGIEYDILVALNAAALKKHGSRLKPGGLLIVNTGGFDARNLQKAGYASNPLEDQEFRKKYSIIEVDVSRLVREALADSSLSTKERDRTKNMFVLGLCAWLFNRDIDVIERELRKKFGGKEELLDANLKVLRAGYSYGETAEIVTTRFSIYPAPLPQGEYRFINGNESVALGIMLAHEKTGLPIVYASYPITPASDILHYFAAHYNYEGLHIVQAEDEIAAICCAIGASYGGGIGVCATSGPGFSLKAEALGLATILELPLVVIDIQRAGPSTGMPTKTEQGDLLMAMFGRHGEAPVPVLAISSPSNAIQMAYYAVKIAIEHMTPVVLLSDAYIASGVEPMKIIDFSSLPSINIPWFKENGKYSPYQRDEKLARKWVAPGTPGLMHQIGGLEKEDVTGKVSYDPENHQKMVLIRAKKVEKIADFIPPLELEIGSTSDDYLVLAWGSAWGASREAVLRLRKEEKLPVAFACLHFLNPFPKNLPELLNKFKKVIIPENNMGQLSFLIQGKYLIKTWKILKIKGLPFAAEEVMKGITKIIEDECSEVFC